MQVQAKIQKRGNDLALRLSGALRDLLQFKEGTEVKIEVTEEGFTIKRTASKKRLCLPFTETKLLLEMTPELAHADVIGKPIARELAD